MKTLLTVAFLLCTFATASAQYDKSNSSKCMIVYGFFNKGNETYSLIQDANVEKISKSAEPYAYDEATSTLYLHDQNAIYKAVLLPKAAKKMKKDKNIPHLPTSEILAGIETAKSSINDLAASMGLEITKTVTVNNDRHHTVTSGEFRTLTSVTKEPQFRGGQAGLFKYIAQNLHYPANAKAKNIQGVVEVGFTIDKDGKVGNVHVTKAVDPELDAEAVRLITSSPKWEPARKGTKKVDAEQIVPIAFEIPTE